MERIIKPAFTVIGKEGSTRDGEGFIQRLWEDANGHFGEIAPLAKTENGQLVGVWGAMSDFSRSFQPWEEGFTQGLYLAGAECVDNAQPPAGWTKWIIPGYEYLRVESPPPPSPTPWPIWRSRASPWLVPCMISPTPPPEKAICVSLSGSCEQKQAPHEIHHAVPVFYNSISCCTFPSKSFQMNFPSSSSI